MTLLSKVVNKIFNGMLDEIIKETVKKDENSIDEEILTLKQRSVSFTPILEKLGNIPESLSNTNVILKTKRPPLPANARSRNRTMTIPRKAHQMGFEDLNYQVVNQGLFTIAEESETSKIDETISQHKDEKPTQSLFSVDEFVQDTIKSGISQYLSESKGIEEKFVDSVIKSALSSTFQAKKSDQIKHHITSSKEIKSMPSISCPKNPLLPPEKKSFEEDYVNSIIKLAVSEYKFWNLQEESKTPVNSSKREPFATKEPFITKSEQNINRKEPFTTKESFPAKVEQNSTKKEPFTSKKEPFAIKEPFTTKTEQITINKGPFATKEPFPSKEGQNSTKKEPFLTKKELITTKTEPFATKEPFTTKTERIIINKEPFPTKEGQVVIKKEPFITKEPFPTKIEQNSTKKEPFALKTQPTETKNEPLSNIETLPTTTPTIQSSINQEALSPKDPFPNSDVHDLISILQRNRDKKEPGAFLGKSVNSQPRFVISDPKRSDVIRNRSSSFEKQRIAEQFVDNVMEIALSGGKK